VESWNGLAGALLGSLNDLVFYSTWYRISRYCVPVLLKASLGPGLPRRSGVACLEEHWFPNSFFFFFHKEKKILNIYLQYKHSICYKWYTHISFILPSFLHAFFLWCWNRALCMLGKHSTTKLYQNPRMPFLIFSVLYGTYTNIQGLEGVIQ
jgi:hypothetical protein